MGRSPIACVSKMGGGLSSDVNYEDVPRVSVGVGVGDER